MIDMSNKLLLLLSVLLLIYLIIGAVAFCYIEKDAQKSMQENSVTNFTIITETFLDSHPSMTREDVEDLIEVVVSAYVRDHAAGNRNKTSWNVAQGFYYAATIITTIGYGDVVTITPGGQWLTVIYGIIGIPLNLTMLAGVGTKIRQLIKALLTKIQKTRGEDWSLKKNKTIGVTSIVFLGILFMFIIPTLIFSKLESWTFTEAFYFSFVTLSTIGFGDYVASRDSNYSNGYLALYRILLLVWIYLGLAWLSTLISVLQDIYNSAIESGETKLEHQISKRIKAVGNISQKMKDKLQDAIQTQESQSAFDNSAFANAEKPEYGVP